jgi:hypothetical protein
MDVGDEEIFPQWNGITQIFLEKDITKFWLIRLRQVNHYVQLAPPLSSNPHFLLFPSLHSRGAPDLAD